VTGLIVNKKPNVKKEYWRTVKSQCNRLFRTGEFIKKTDKGELKGNNNVLEGQLNFIDQVDLYNRRRQKPPLNPIYQRVGTNNAKDLLSGREKTFRKFLFYRLFYANTAPTILCEGKTDNIYLKCAISKLVGHYPSLAKGKTKTDPYKLLVRFVKYSNRTRFLLQLHGGVSYLCKFTNYFDKHYQFYKAPLPKEPVIMILDNDSGPTDLLNAAEKHGSEIIYPKKITKEEGMRKADFIHVMHNLYIVLTPLGKAKETEIEDLFDPDTKEIKLRGKSFNPGKNFDKDSEYGKEYFAKKVVKAQKVDINFDGFKPLLDRVTEVIKHYQGIVSDR